MKKFIKEVAGFLIIGAVIMLFVGVVFAYNSFNSEDYELVEVFVGEGQTAWQIQSSLAPNGNIRAMLYELNKINDRDMGQIQRGQVLLFFKCPTL